MPLPSPAHGQILNSFKNQLAAIGFINGCTRYPLPSQLEVHSVCPVIANAAA